MIKPVYRHLTKLVLAFAVTLVAASCGRDTAASYFALKEGFVTPADTMQVSVYWYSVSDNISKEGVVRDLKAMKEAGINRAFIGNIGIDDIPYGNVRMFSAEWWEILHTALKTAGDLDIEIGIFNSPGWSQSGGPWITADESMRYLISSEIVVEGPGLTERRLPQPAAEYQDVKVIAYPAPAGYDRTITVNNTVLSATSRTEIKFTSPDDFTARSLTVRPTPHPLKVTAELQVKEGKDFRTIKSFDIDRSNPQLNVGFDPYAPVVVSFPETTGREFRLIISGPPARAAAAATPTTPTTPTNPANHASRAATGAGIAEATLATLPRVERYAEKTLAKMFQSPLPYWHEYQWPVQPESDDQATVIDPGRVLDITTEMTADGLLRWEVPEGTWIVQRSGMTPTGVTNAPASPEARGYEVDKLSKKHVQEHFYAFIGRILDSIPAEDRKTFHVVVADSYETGGQNFTDGFMEDFRERYGYDMLPYLPVYQGMVVGSQDESDRFLWDLRRLIADKVAYDYVGGMREICHRHGLRTWLENYGHWGFPGEFLQYGGQSDEVSGEFWSEGDQGDIENRAASSSGHIYGKQKISAESFTAAGSPYSRYPANMKERGDRFFAEGINNTLLHVYISQPYRGRPGVNAWFGNEFNRNNTWFRQLDLFTDYLKRSNYMLQQGLNVADVAYFIGEDTPKMTGITDPPLPRGYQFDYINAEVLERDATVRDGRITLPHGTSYAVLVLPQLETMRPELLSRLQQMVRDGAVILGAPPRRSPSLQNQPAADLLVKATADDMWGDLSGVTSKSIKYGKGTILYGQDLSSALGMIDCPADFSYEGDMDIAYNHRRLPGMDIYFVANQSAETREFTATFRVAEHDPELWLATTGELRSVEGHKTGKENTTVPLKLAPYESVFVVFGQSKDSGALHYSADPEVIGLEGAWSVKFDARRRGPDEAVTFAALSDWKDHSDPKIRYYSGQAVYTKEFTMNSPHAGERVMLDLGSLSAMAKVTLNGEYAGGVWTPPYELDITKFLKDGVNTLEIEVVNTWVNRLIGDSLLSGQGRRTWTYVNPYGPQSPLQPSGLFGPVELKVHK